MKPSRISLLVQLGFALLYLVMGFMLLLNPVFKEKFGEPVRIGLGIILLAYAGYRLFAVYKKYVSYQNDEE